MKPNWDELWQLYLQGAELCELSREATGNAKRPKHGTLRNHASKHKWSVGRELARAERRIQGDRNDEELQEKNICPSSYDNARPNCNSIGLVSSSKPRFDYFEANHGRGWRQV